MSSASLAYTLIVDTMGDFWLPLWRETDLKARHVPAAITVSGMDDSKFELSQTSIEIPSSH